MSLMLTFFEVVGSVQTPGYLYQGYGDYDNPGGGIIGLVSNLVKLVISVGGLFTFINLLLAGMSYIASGEKPDELQKAHARIYMSIIGLVVMVGSFVLSGLVGIIIYGNATAILNPQIYGPNEGVQSTMGGR